MRSERKIRNVMVALFLAAALVAAPLAVAGESSQPDDWSLAAWVGDLLDGLLGGGGTESATGEDGSGDDGSGLPNHGPHGDPNG